MFELIEDQPQSAVIKVIGVGGGGGNAVQHMLNSNVSGVDFVAANTDAQALQNVNARTILQMGSGITKGLGAGADPEVGRLAAEEDRDRLTEILRDSDMVFITAGMGGGTGTGAAPVVAEVARDLGILTVAVVTRPFGFERRAKVAESGLQALAERVDSLIIIPNEKLFEVLGREASMLSAFAAANDVLLGAVQGIADLIIRPGMINVDFADVRTVMSEMGMAMMGTGEASGEHRARTATETAIGSPLLDDVDLHGARGILVNVTAGPDLSIGEFAEVGDTIEEFASEQATVVVGTVIDPELTGELRVTVVATGVGGPHIQTAAAKLEPTPPERSSRRASKPDVVVDNVPLPAAVNVAGRERPAVLRNRSGAGQGDSGSVAGATGGRMGIPREHARSLPDGGAAGSREVELLDIPSFLQHQAD